MWVDRPRSGLEVKKKKKGKKAAKQYEYEQSLGKEERCVSFWYKPSESSARPQKNVKHLRPLFSNSIWIMLSQNALLASFPLITSSSN